MVCAGGDGTAVAVGVGVGGSGVGVGVGGSGVGVGVGTGEGATGVAVGGTLVGEAGAASCDCPPQTMRTRAAVASRGSMRRVFSFSGINSQCPEPVLVLMDTPLRGLTVSRVQSAPGGGPQVEGARAVLSARSCSCGPRVGCQRNTCRMPILSVGQ